MKFKIAIALKRVLGPQKAAGFLLAIIAIAMFILTACAPITGEVVAEQPIKVGFIGPMTGEAAFLGESSVKGIQLAIDDINAQGGIKGKPVKLIVEDDQLIDRQTQSAYHKLTDIDKVDAIFSVSYGGVLSLADQAAQDEVVIVETIDVSEELAEAGDYVFAIGIYDEGIGYTMAEIAKEHLDEDKIAIIFYQAEPFVVLAKDSLKQKFEELGGEIVIEQGYAPDTKDFRTMIMKAKEAGVDTIAVLSYDEGGLALKQAKELDLGIQFIGMDTFSSEVFLDIAGEAADGAYFTFWEASDKEEWEAFEKKFEAKFGEKPAQPMFTATSFDAMKVVAKAMEKGQRGEALKQALHEIKDFDGIAGDLTIEEDGVVRSVFEAPYQIQGREFVKI